MKHIYHMAFRDYFYERLGSLSHRRPFEFPPDTLPVEHRTAAVLLAFWPNGDSVEVVFTRRPETMSSHPGQVSFPGGRVDPEDASIADAALREANEELGIDPTRVSLMGRLDDAWSIAGHHVIPYIGWLKERPEMIANEAEVAEIMVADVELLMQPETSCLHEHKMDGETRHTQAFKWDNGYVWGLTADLMFELLLWVKNEPSNRGQLRLEFVRKMLKAEAS
ncbi:MAG: NUDIX domain-containing protein [Gammaproteobacteria bacterium]|nr:NUDIX domain-containing protein [Gammaproteobacteria bacterium]